MTAEPGRGMPADGSGNARASDADRERAIDILSAAFATAGLALGVLGLALPLLVVFVL